jgi:hypothetical protein
MRAGMARVLTWLYPPAWRERYGEEYQAMLEMGPGDLGTLSNGVWAAVREHINPTYRGGVMTEESNSFAAMMRRPSAFVPIAMSMVALAMVLWNIGMSVAQAGRVARDPDEGTVAHLFQILMTVQWPIMAFLAVKWLRRAPGQTLRVLALQAGAWLAACAPVYFLHL